MRVRAGVGVGLGLGVRVRMRVSASPDLPVGAVATAAHGPGDEGCSGRRRPEDGRGESRTSIKTSYADSDQRVWQCEGGESTTRREGTITNSVNGLR